MTYPAALALTGAMLFVVAFACLLALDLAMPERTRRIVICVMVTGVLASIGCVLGAIWWAAE